MPALSAKVGANTVQGKLEFSPAFEPIGALTFDLPDIGLLAALGGQKASGDLKGSVDLTNTEGRIGLKLNATGSGIRRDDLAIVKPEIALTVDDLKAFSANGSVRAQEIASGDNRVSGLALTFKQQASRTDFDLNAAYDGRPLTAAGNVETGGGQTVVSLNSFAATPRTIPVSLAAPSRIVIKGGVVTLDNLTIRTGGGSVVVSGTAGDTLKINARIADLPASLANSFAPGLDAAGTISGTVSVTGKPAAPVVDFQANWANAATSQTRSAGLGALALRTNGRFADNRVTIDGINLTGAGGLALNGSGNVAISGDRALAMKIDGTLPFTALAGQLAAQGFDMTGSARINLQIAGTAAAPLVTGTITTDGTRLVDVRRNMAMNDLAVDDHARRPAGDDLAIFGHARDRRQRVGERHGRHPAGKRVSGRHQYPSRPRDLCRRHAR